MPAFFLQLFYVVCFSHFEFVYRWASCLPRLFVRRLVFLFFLHSSASDWSKVCPDNSVQRFESASSKAIVDIRLCVEQWQNRSQSDKTNLVENTFHEYSVLFQSINTLNSADRAHFLTGCLSSFLGLFATFIKLWKCVFLWNFVQPFTFRPLCNQIKFVSQCKLLLLMQRQHSLNTSENHR